MASLGHGYEPQPPITVTVTDVIDHEVMLEEVLANVNFEAHFPILGDDVKVGEKVLLHRPVDGVWYVTKDDGKNLWTKPVF